MNAPQKRNNKREKEGTWRRSLSSIAILKYLYSIFLDKTEAFAVKGLIFNVKWKPENFNDINS